jgi:hypothetical protein
MLLRRMRVPSAEISVAHDQTAPTSEASQDDRALNGNGTFNVIYCVRENACAASDQYDNLMYYTAGGRRCMTAA